MKIQKTLVFLFLLILPYVFSSVTVQPSPSPSPSPYKNYTWEELFGLWLDSDGDQCEIITDIWNEFCDIDDDDFSGEPSSWCDKLYDKYEDSCDDEESKILDAELLTTLLAVAFCIMFSSWLELMDWYWIAGSGVTIIVGAAIGGLAWLFDQNSGFSEEFFFFFLIPPILFQAGIEIDKEMLLKNLGSILGFALIGTTIATSIVFGMLAPFGLMPSLECAVFGALISAVDPIAILAIFNNFNVDKELFTIVFGESAMNDGVAVVIYKQLYSALTEEKGDRPIDGFSLFYSCVLVFCSSALMGILFAFISAVFLKWRNFSKLRGVRETLVLILWSLVPYYVSESLGLSGIVTILFEGIFIDLYTYQNLSEASQHHFHFVTSSLAFFCETTIFAYLGVEIVMSDEQNWRGDLVLLSMLAVLVSRLSIFPLCWALNLLRKKPIPFSFQAGLWFAGLRGGIAFALAYNIPEWDEVLNSGTEYRGDIIAATIAVILMEVFIFGSSLIMPLLKWFGLKINEGDSIDVNTELVSRLSEEVRSSTTNYGSFEIAEPRSSEHDDLNWYQRKLLEYHENYLLPFLTHAPKYSKIRPLSTPILDEQATQQPHVSYSRRRAYSS